jgi:hypothetical protein
MPKPIFSALILLTLAIGGVTPASAKVYQILYRGTDVGFDLSFLPDGERICSFTAIFIDNSNYQNLEIRLLRRKIVLGETINSFDRPLTLAMITTGTPADGVQKQSAPDIRGPLIDNGSYFYSWDFSYVGDNDGNPMDMLGLQIDVRPKCP